MILGRNFGEIKHHSCSINGRFQIRAQNGLEILNFKHKTLEGPIEIGNLCAMVVKNHKKLENESEYYRLNMLLCSSRTDNCTKGSEVSNVVWERLWADGVSIVILAKLGGSFGWSFDGVEGSLWELLDGDEERERSEA